MKAANSNLAPLLEGSLALLRAPQIQAEVDKLKRDKTRLRTDMALLLGLLRNLHREVPNKDLANCIEHICETMRVTQ